jgi:peptide chain release factor subunit 1
MPKSTTGLETPLRQQLDRLASLEPAPLPVLSVYLDLQSKQEGREQYDTFLTKAFADRARAFAAGTPERQSYDRDVERIREYLGGDVRPSSNGVAIFACDGADLFEAIQIEAPLDDNWLFVGSVPHLYPLARVNDQYPRYAALVADTNSARLFVFSLGTSEDQQKVQNEKTKRTDQGGWSQARFQRRVDNLRAQHIKEVVALLDKTVREESINHIIVSCDDVAKPMLFDELPKHLAEKIVDLVPMAARTPDHEVLAATLEALRKKDGETDVERVEAMIGAWRAGGLGAAGAEATLEALELGSVEELLITASPSGVRAPKKMPMGATADDAEVETSAQGTVDTQDMAVADALVAKAQQQAARIRFIEDPKLLEPVGGCGAILRFRVQKKKVG